MKRKKFIALLCVAATSASLVTPVMAEENQAVETVQETAVEQETTGQETTKQEAPVGEVPVEEEALVPEESTAENPENETSEATNTIDTYLSHYFNYDGTMLKNAYHYNVNGYDENGKMLKGTGWYLDTYNIWRYIYSDGTMATGERTIGGKKYWFTGYGDWIR